MQNSFALHTGVLAIICTFSPYAIASNSTELLTGIPKLACEATLCLSSSLRPGECNPSLDHYFDIKKYKKGSLDWGATVAARKTFLSQCPAVSSQQMTERIDAISKGAGKCDADFLNRQYAGTAYKWRKRGYRYDVNTGIREPVYEVHPIDTVTLSKLPTWCANYNDHDWTYQLTVKYVGKPNMGGYWVNANRYEPAQSSWDAEYTGKWASNWTYSLTDPRK